MKIDKPKEWWSKRAELEGDSAIGAGTMPTQLTGELPACLECGSLVTEGACGDCVAAMREAIEKAHEALSECANKLHPIRGYHGKACYVAGEPCWNCRTAPTVDAAIALLAPFLAVRRA